MAHPRVNATTDLPAPWEPLYAAVGAAMWGVSRLRFSVEALPDGVPRVERGQLWVATHRAETDVPLLGGLMYTAGGMWRHGAARMSFGARDDLFAPGIVPAHVRLPAPLARRAWRLTPGPWLPRVRAHPVRRPTGAKLGQLLAASPLEARIGDILGPGPSARLAERARRGGLPAPATVGDALQPRYARVLWTDVTEADLDTTAGRELWRRHTRQVSVDVRRLVAILSDGGPLLLFPEGRVSPDGSVGPTGRILDVVIRRGRPTAVVAVGIAYDPLHGGRPTAAVGFATTAGDVPAAAVADAMRRAIPLTCGQVVADRVHAASAASDAPAAVLSRRDLEGDLDAAVRAAVRAGRPVAQGLAAGGAIPRRVTAALHELARRGCARVDGDDVAIDPDRVRADGAVARLAVEARSAGVPASGEPAPRSA